MTSKHEHIISVMQQKQVTWRSSFSQSVSSKFYHLELGKLKAWSLVLLMLIIFVPLGEPGSLAVTYGRVSSRQSTTCLDNNLLAGTPHLAYFSGSSRFK